MKFVYRLEGLDCANCAAKIEAAVSKIDGVEKASVSFLAQKLTIECDGSRKPQVYAKAKDICRKVEPDCVLVEK